jgi:alpha-glucosidase
MIEKFRWWQSGVFYQVYPRSFQDTDGDGVGDLRGVAARLPYLRELGVDALWLSPVFPSPMADFGYDISDYTGIDALFGTLDDLDALVTAAHAHGLKVILDLVANHTSEQHPWFAESRSSRDNPKRDWYIWRDGKGDGPPNNWLSEFGGSAWQFDRQTGQYYYHAFLRAQPDLNWRNPQVCEAMHEVMRFWLQRGIDGFRVDAMWHLIKDDLFRDDPPNPDATSGQAPYQKLLHTYSGDRPEVHAVAADMRRVMDGFNERVLIGEIYLSPDKLVAFYGRDLKGVQLPFNFALISAPWTAAAISNVIDIYEAALPPGAWPNWVLGNHDRPRIASRAGEAQARVAAMLLLTLRGTPTLYYGDEIGMKQVPIAADQVCDPWEKNLPGRGLGRDGCRTPMQWDSSLHAGFTDGMPWLPLDTDFAVRNVATGRQDRASILNLYRALLALRRARPELTVGAYSRLALSGDLLVYRREHEGRHLAVALNFGSTPAPLPEAIVSCGKIVLSTFMDRTGQPVEAGFVLRAAEGAVIEF